MTLTNRKQRRPFGAIQLLERRIPLAGDLPGVFGATAVEVAEASVPVITDARPPLEVRGNELFTTQSGELLELRMKLGNGQSSLIKSIPNRVLFRAPCSCEQQSAVVVGDNLYFAVATTIGYEDEGILPFGELDLWKSDGTTEGTRSLKTGLAPWSSGREAVYADLRDGGEEQLLMAVTQVESAQIWISDGTAEGTQPVGPFFGTGFEPPVRELTEISDGFVFMGAQDELHYGVWFTSANKGGESELLRLFDGDVFASALWPRNFTAVGDVVFFTAPTADAGMELWVTDGTPQGTMLAVDVLPGPQGSNPQNLVASDGRLFFSIVEDNQVRWWSVNSEWPPTDSLPGDLNRDGSIDFTDFLILSANFGKDVDGGPSDGDIDENGIVEFADFLVLSANFGKTLA